jgi:AcrR family transcriptional regulator
LAWPSFGTRRWSSRNHGKPNRKKAAAGRGRHRGSYGCAPKSHAGLVGQGLRKTSIADLTKAGRVDYRALRKTFGTRKDILRAAIRFCAETEASLAQEPLRVSPTGREAILAMLEENVRLRRHWPGDCGCLFMFNGFIVPPDETDLQDYLFEKRRSLSKHIRARLARSVGEAELPGDVNCQALTDLCLAILGGITFRVLDATPPSLLFRSIALFVDMLGFTGRRRPRAPKARR